MAFRLQQLEKGDDSPNSVNGYLQLTRCLIVSHEDVTSDESIVRRVGELLPNTCITRNKVQHYVFCLYIYIYFNVDGRTTK